MTKTCAPCPSPDRLREVLTYCPETGILAWKPNVHHQRRGLPAGHPNNKGYLIVVVDGWSLLVSRIAWAMTHDAWPELQIDHRNGLCRDNSLSNLRQASASQNNFCKTGKSKAVSGVRGVYPVGNGRFVAKFTHNYKVKHLGTFDTIASAQSAYETAALQAHGTFLGERIALKETLSEVKP